MFPSVSSKNPYSFQCICYTQIFFPKGLTTSYFSLLPPSHEDLQYTKCYLQIKTLFQIYKIWNPSMMFRLMQFVKFSKHILVERNPIKYILKQTEKFILKNWTNFNQTFHILYYITQLCIETEYQANWASSI